MLCQTTSPVVKRLGFRKGDPQRHFVSISDEYGIERSKMPSLKSSLLVPGRLFMYRRCMPWRLTLRPQMRNVFASLEHSSRCDSSLYRHAMCRSTVSQPTSITQDVYCEVWRPAKFELISSIRERGLLRSPAGRYIKPDVPDHVGAKGLTLRLGISYASQAGTVSRMGIQR